MIGMIAMVAMLNAGPAPAAPSDSWFGADKWKHFLMSAFVQSATFSVARAAGVSRPNARIVAGVSTMTAGVWKEVLDRRRGQSFSGADLSWDAAGALAAAALLNGTR